MSPEVSPSNIFQNGSSFHFHNKGDASLLKSFLRPVNFPRLADRGVGDLVAEVEVLVYLLESVDCLVPVV